MGIKNFFMVFYFLKGCLVFVLGIDGKKLRIKSKEKCNDGKWYMVVFGYDGEKGCLVVDGLRVWEGSLFGNFIVSIRGLVYLGLFLLGKLKSFFVNSFVGCLKNF